MMNVEFKVINFQDGEKARITKEFSQKLAENIFKQAKRHFDAAEGDDHPLLYSERGMYSTIAVAVDKITPLHLSEYPLKKAKDKRLKINTGMRVDLWCNYREVDYFIEVKRSVLNLSEKAKLRKETKEAIKSLISKIKNLKPKSKKLEWTEKAVRLGLFIVLPWITNKEPQKGKDEVIELLQRGFGPNLNFLSIWNLSQRMRVMDYSTKEKEHKEYNPFIIIALTFDVDDK
ncbi:MAG: hypothetical protein FJ139_01735 [Deltaproteobacteria bacterium]|nr:hypothetical protein [Deltaproteobacteria bacterium]